MHNRHDGATNNNVRIYNLYLTFLELQVKNNTNKVHVLSVEIMRVENIFASEGFKFSNKCDARTPRPSN